MEKPVTLNAIANTFCAKAVMLTEQKKKNLYTSNSAICLTGLQNRLTFLRQQICFLLPEIPLQRAFFIMNEAGTDVVGFYDNVFMQRGKAGGKRSRKNFCVGRQTGTVWQSEGAALRRPESRPRVSASRLRERVIFSIAKKKHALAGVGKRKESGKEKGGTVVPRRTVVPLKGLFLQNDRFPERVVC